MGERIPWASDRWDIQWKDSGREPQCAPDPAYPNGKELGCVVPSARACKALLAYPAKRCGIYIVRCKVCGMSAAVTTAGRPDNPRSVWIPCIVAKKDAH